MGHSIYDFTHPCDHTDIKDLFSVDKTDKADCQYRSGFFRMKCTITSKGRSVHLRAASYKVSKKSHWLLVINELNNDLNILLTQIVGEYINKILNLFRLSTVLAIFLLETTKQVPSLNGTSELESPYRIQQIFRFH